MSEIDFATDSSASPDSPQSRDLLRSAAVLVAAGVAIGPPVLLLHGAPQSHASWYRVAPELARDPRRGVQGSDFYSFWI